MIKSIVARLSQKPALPNWVINLGKALLVCTILYLLYYSIQKRASLQQEFFDAFTAVWSIDNLGYGVVIILLLFLNIGLEGRKWQLLASKIEALSFGEAMQGVLTGMSLSFLSTSYTGNYFGRVWHMKEANRYHILGGMVVNSIAQAAVTYVFGGVGLLFFLQWIGMIEHSTFLWATPAYILYSLTLIYIVFRYTGIVEKLEGWPWLYRHLRVIASYGLRDSLHILMLSALRYCTFTLQFGLCLWLFDPNLSAIHALSGIAVIYLAKATIPNVSFLTDLGIRELSAVQLFGPNGFDASEGAVMAATLSLWAINLLLPVIIGSYFVVKMKIRR